MDVRPARAADGPEIETIARQSFETSYALSPDQIDTIVDEVFSEEVLADRIEDPEVLVFVAEGEREDLDEEGGVGIVGFAVAELGDVATLRWLHVKPGYRGEGVGTALVERVRGEFEDRNRRFTARLLETATEGGEFLDRFGLHRSGNAALEFDAESFKEQVYTVGSEENEANEPSVEVPETITVDGDDLPVDREDRIPGTESPFFHVYTDRTRERRWGYFCSNCGSSDVAADGLDRLECNNCGNEHRADEWDGAYL